MTNTLTALKMEQFYLFMQCFLKDANGLANSADPDQTAPFLWEQSDLDLHCLLRPICPNN